MKVRRHWDDVQSTCKKSANKKILYPAKPFSIYEEEIKTFPGKQKLREFIINILDLKYLLQENCQLNERLDDNLNLYE